MLQLYDQLLKFPLFQGMGYNDLTQLVAHTKLDFHKFEPNRIVVRQGDVCQNIYFLTKGTLAAYTHSADDTCIVEERIDSPYTLQPERLFGLEQRYHTTFETTTDSNLISIDKKEMVQLLQDQPIIRINFINQLSAMIQKAQKQVWEAPPEDVLAHIVRFFRLRCTIPTGPKTIHIKMTQLAREVNDSRLDVSHVLNRMQDNGILKLKRQRIEIYDIEKLTTGNNVKY